MKLALTDFILDSYLIEKVKIYKQALACFMMMAHLRLPRGRRNEPHMVKSISRRVSHHLKPVSGVKLTRIQRKKQIGLSLHFSVLRFLTLRSLNPHLQICRLTIHYFTLHIQLQLMTLHALILRPTTPVHRHYRPP